MPRPVQCWYLTPRDICKCCDLTANSVEQLHKAGQVTDELLSLLIFTASNLKPSYRKSLKETLALGKYHYTHEPQVGDWKHEHEGTFELQWTATSKTISEALGITINSWHVSFSREVVDPSNLFSLVRYACLYARPDIRAMIAGAVFRE